MNKTFGLFTIRLRKYWEKHPAIPWLLSILWVLLIGWLAFFWHLGSMGLVDETEPLFAEAARQMVVTGDWITPYFNGQTRFDKPALIYWLMVIAYRILGVNEWAVRLPSALAALALTSLGFYTLLRFGFPNPKGKKDGEVGRIFQSPIPNPQSPIPNPQYLSAWIGAALIALNPLTIAWARTGVSDMLLSGCMGMALLCFFMGYAQEKRSPLILNISHWYVGFYVFSGLAVLTKGPVGIVLPIIIMGSFLLYLGNWREVCREMRLVRGSLIFLAIALPWYILCTWKNGSAFINSFFGYHNIERFTQVVNLHSAPWYFYFLVVAVGFFPWVIYLPLAIARLRFWEIKKWRNSSRSTQLGLFALFWFFGVFCFFTIAVTKLPSYVLPLIPAAAILVSLLFSEQLTFVTTQKFLNDAQGRLQTNTALFVTGILNVIICILVAGFFLYLPNILGYDPAMPNLRQLLEKSGLAIRSYLIWGITAISALVLLQHRRRLPWLISVNFFGLVAFFVFVLIPASFILDEFRQLPLRQLAAVVTQVQKPGEELFMIGFKKPSLVFYTQRKVDYFDTFPDAFQYVKKTAASNKKRSSILIISQYDTLDPRFLQGRKYKTFAKTKAYRLIRLIK